MNELRASDFGLGLFSWPNPILFINLSMEEQPRSTDLRLIALAIRSGTFKPRPETVQILEEIADYLDFLEESVLEELDKVPYIR